MPRKKKNSPYYKVQRKNLPGYGDTGLLSTRTTSLKVAREMEDLLPWLVDQGAYEVLDALRPTGRGATGRVTLADVLRAKREGRFGEWRRTLDDPDLEDAIRAFAKRAASANHRLGLRHVLRLTVTDGGPRLAPTGARLSWMTKARSINAVTSHMIGEGYAPNTVQNGVWYGLSKLFQHHYGVTRARSILAEANRPSSDDAREVWLTAAEVHRLVSACEWEVRMALLVMAALGVDVKPLLNLRVRNVDLVRRQVFLPDTKNKNRMRWVGMAPVVTLVLALLCDGRAESESVLSLTRGQLSHRWRKARAAARLTEDAGFQTDVRLKDLRHTFAVHYLQGGGSIGGLGNRMGHRELTQTLAYAKHEVTGVDDMEGAARSLGLELTPALEARLDELVGRADVDADVEDIEMPAWWFDRGAAPRIEDESAGTVTLAVTGHYRTRGTAGWDTSPEGRRAYLAGLQAERASRPGDTSGDTGPESVSAETSDLGRTGS